VNIDGEKMDDLARKTLLYDFYGEMLTQRQQEIYENYYLNDLSLGEIAEELGISRAGVHDNIKRSEKALTNYEERLQLIDRYMENKQVISQVLEMTYESGEDTLIRIRQLITDFLKAM